MASRLSIALTGELGVGEVTAQVWDGGDANGPVTVLAHGAGSSLDHVIHQSVCAAVAERGHTVWAFNFAYAQAGRRAPDRMPALRRCYLDVLAHVRAAHVRRPLVIGGRSMGGRVASLLVADGLAVDGLALLNYPIMPSRRTPDSKPRTDHWEEITGPVLFLQGTRDRLFDRAVFAASRPLLHRADVTVVDIPDADHSFAVPRRAGQTLQEVYATVGSHISRWLRAAVPTAGSAA